MSILFPCGGVNASDASLKVTGDVITYVDSVATTFDTIVANCGSIKLDDTYFKNTNGVLTSVDSTFEDIEYTLPAPCGGFVVDEMHFWYALDGAICFSPTPIYFALSVSSEIGSTFGVTKITVEQPLRSGHTYVYQTATTLVAPDFQEDLSLWTAWDGVEEIVAIADEEIYIAEVDASNLCWFTGMAIVNSTKEITATSVAGTLSGDTLITVDPALTNDNTYIYKTGETVEVPVYGDELFFDETYTAWDGTSDITATTGDEIVIVEINPNGDCRAADKTIVVSKA